MFDEHQQPKPHINITPSLITLVCGAGGILLSFGLCGAAASSRLSFFSDAGIALFSLSLLALLIGFFWLLIVTLINATRR